METNIPRLVAKLSTERGKEIQSKRRIPLDPNSNSALNNPTLYLVGSNRDGSSSTRTLLKRQIAITY
jgi:hypothetical protein